MNFEPKEIHVDFGGHESWCADAKPPLRWSLQRIPKLHMPRLHPGWSTNSLIPGDVWEYPNMFTNIHSKTNGWHLKMGDPLEARRFLLLETIIFRVHRGYMLVFGGVSVYLPSATIHSKSISSGVVTNATGYVTFHLIDMLSACSSGFTVKWQWIHVDSACLLNEEKSGQINQLKVGEIVFFWIVILSYIV